MSRVFLVLFTLILRGLCEEPEPKIVVAEKFVPGAVPKDSYLQAYEVSHSKSELLKKKDREYLPPGDHGGYPDALYNQVDHYGAPKPNYGPPSFPRYF